MSFQRKLITKTVLRFCWLRLLPPNKRRRLFSRIFSKSAHHSNPSHKKILPFQQLFHLAFKQKDKQNFRRNQEYNRYKENHIFHAHHLLDFNFYDNIPAINPQKFRLERHFFRFCRTDYFCGGGTDVTGFFKSGISGNFRVNAFRHNNLQNSRRNFTKNRAFALSFFIIKRKSDMECRSNNFRDFIY